MSTPIPAGLGPFQTLFYKIADSLTLPMEDVKNTVTTDPTLLKIKEEQAAANKAFTDATKALYSFELPSPPIAAEYDESKFNALLPSINIQLISNDITTLEECPSCDKAYWDMQDRLNKIKIGLASKCSELDARLYKLKEHIPFLDKLLMLCPPTPPMILANPMKFLTWLIDILKIICYGIVMPTVRVIDEFYVFYRQCCNDMAVLIASYLGPVKIKCIDNCKYQGKETECIIVKKNNWTSCKVKPAFNVFTSVSSSLIGLIDLTLMPVNILFQTFSTAIKPFKIVGVAPRAYPPQNMALLVSLIKAQATTSSVKTTILPPFPI